LGSGERLGEGAGSNVVVMRSILKERPRSQQGRWSPGD
jgi:hypothetical protein